MKSVSLLFLLVTASTAFAAETIRVDVAKPTTVVERIGITGAGWAAIVNDGPRRTVELICPNHPDDFGVTAGTGCCRSMDDGMTWTQAADDGRTWSRVEKLLAGPERQIVAGKLPNLQLMPNGLLVLLTSHTKLGCRLYVAADSAGRAWSDVHIVTPISGGNTSMVRLDDETLLVFTPSSKRISCHRVTLKALQK